MSLEELSKQHNPLHHHRRRRPPPRSRHLLRSYGRVRRRLRGLRLDRQVVEHLLQRRCNLGQGGAVARVGAPAAVRDGRVVSGRSHGEHRPRAAAQHALDDDVLGQPGVGALGGVELPHHHAKCEDVGGGGDLGAGLEELWGEVGDGAFRGGGLGGGGWWWGVDDECGDWIN